jgi:phosphate transport system protein
MQNRHECDGLSGQLIKVIELSRILLEHLTAALCDPDPSASTRLPDAAKALHALRQAVDDQALAIEQTRLQPSPIALQTVVAAAQANADAEGVAELARRLAEIAGARPSRPTGPADVQAIVCSMGRVCVDMMAMASDTKGSALVDTEARIDAANAELHRLRQRLYRLLLHSTGPVDVDAALDASLTGGYYLRCADHAISMARHAVLATDVVPV